MTYSRFGYLLILVGGFILLLLAYKFLTFDTLEGLRIAYSCGMIQVSSPIGGICFNNLFSDTINKLIFSTIFLTLFVYSLQNLFSKIVGNEREKRKSLE